MITTLVIQLLRKMSMSEEDYEYIGDIALAVFVILLGISMVGF